MTKPKTIDIVVKVRVSSLTKGLKALLENSDLKLRKPLKLKDIVLSEDFKKNLADDLLDVWSLSNEDDEVDGYEVACKLFGEDNLVDAEEDDF